MHDLFTHIINFKPATLICVALGALGSGECAAQLRAFPAQAQYCQIDGHGLPTEATAKINGKIVGLSPALVIRDESNRIVVNAYLPQKVAGMCIQGFGEALEKVWIMTPEQAKEAKRAAKEIAKQRAEQ